jgi:protein O-mannosyl-transferase
LRLAQPNLGPRAAWIAVSAAGLWLLLPLLASTSLIIVQRMASLSATFVLGGLLIYLFGLSWEAAGRITKGRWLQVTGIGFGTLLATLSKENGALLPLYALILESTVLSGVIGLARWRHRRMWLLALAPLVLLAYLVTHISSASFAARDFTLLERLYTQPIILWDYLRLAFFPRSSAFLPFHDDYPIAQGLLDPPIAFIAILAWLILLGLALWQRKRWPWFALAVFWYLGGHLLESSALPLELYYEHRNYVPLMGPMLAPRLASLESDWNLAPYRARITWRLCFDAGQKEKRGQGQIISEMTVPNDPPPAASR